MPPAIDKDAKIPCTSQQQLQGELDALSSVLELGEREDTWEKMERALLRFAGITRGGGYKLLPLYTDGIGRSGMGLAITACMLSDRGRLSGVATDLVQTLAPRLGHSFVPLVSVYMPVLVTLLGRPNKVFLKRAEKCVSTIITHCQLPNILMELRRGLTDDAATCRRGCSAGLLRALDEWPAEVFGPRGVQVIEEALRKVGTDKDPEVRATGKKIYVRYCAIWPERIDEFADPLTPTIRRYLGVGASTGAAPSKPSRRPAPISKPPAPLPTATHEPQAVSHHRVQALGGPAVRPIQAAHAVAHARRSPQKAAVPLAGPSRPVIPFEQEHEPVPARTRVRSGRYPEALAAQPAMPAKVNIFAAPEQSKPAHPVGYGRSASHTILPSGSMVSPEPVRPPSGNGLGHAFRPVIATSASTMSLPIVSSAPAESHEPVRRFAAPATRVVRPPATEEPAHPAPTTPGYALRGAVRPTAQATQAQGMAPAPAPIGGRLGLGQAQRRVISAPTPAQRPPPPIEDTPVPLGRFAPRQADSEDVFGEIEVTARDVEASKVVVITEQPEMEEDKPQENASSDEAHIDSVDVSAQQQQSSAPAEVPLAEAAVGPPNGLTTEQMSKPIPSEVPDTASHPPEAIDTAAATAIPLPVSPIKAAPTVTPASTAVAAVDASAGPSKVTRKTGLPTAARRPAAAPSATGRSVSGTSKVAPAPILPPVRSTKTRVAPAESRPRFKPTSNANANLAGSTGPMSRSASGSTMLSSGTTRQAGPTAPTTNPARAAIPARPAPAEPSKSRNASKPPTVAAPRAAAAAAASRSIPPAAARVPKATVPTAVMPAGYTRPTAASAGVTRGPSSLTAPTAASARRAADRVVSGSSTRGTEADAAKPAVKVTLPPVKRERVKLKAAMPSFQPVRGRTLPGSGSAAGTLASAAAANTARPIPAANAVAKPVVAKVKTIPPPSALTQVAPPPAEVPLPASPGAAPHEVPLPGSPVVEYRGAVRVKKQSMELVQVEDEAVEDSSEGIESRENLAAEAGVMRTDEDAPEGRQEAEGCSAAHELDGHHVNVPESMTFATDDIHEEETTAAQGGDHKLSRIASPASTRSSPAARYHPNGNGAFDDDSEEEEEEPIEDRPAVAPPSRSISQDLLTEHETIVGAAPQSSGEQEEKDLDEPSASSRTAPPFDESLPAIDEAEHGRQTPLAEEASAKQHDAISPRIVLLEKDRNHTPVEMLKTPAKGGNNGEVAEKMRGLTIEAEGAARDDTSIEMEE